VDIRKKKLYELEKEAVKFEGEVRVRDPVLRVGL